MIVKQILPKSYHQYLVRLVLDEEPYEKNIEDLENDKKSIKSENSLFTSVVKERIASIDQDITSVKNGLKKMKDKCPKIEFEGTIEELKYKQDKGETMITLMIPAEIIQSLNDHRKLLTNYKIELLPITM